MKVLVVQNYDNTGLGLVGRALEEAGATLDHRLAHTGDSLPPDASEHDAVVVLGGGQNALDDEGYPYIPGLLELLRDFERREKSALGICLGSQLLARAFGGTNLIGAAPEFGWQPVRLTGAAADDPVLGALPDEFRVFQWHDDTFTLPEGASHLALNDAAANQAFRIGRAVYGFQFHFEADRALIDGWQTAFAHIIAERHPGWPDRYEAEAATHGPGADAAGLAIARAWIGTIA